MKKTLFDQEIDFSLPESKYVCPFVGDVLVTITTSIYDTSIRAKFSRFSPNTWVEITIEDWLTGTRLQYMVADSLERNTKSINP